MNKKCDIPIKSWCAKKVNRCRAGGLISKNFDHSLEIFQILISMALLLFLAIDREIRRLNIETLLSWVKINKVIGGKSGVTNSAKIESDLPSIIF